MSVIHLRRGDSLAACGRHSSSVTPDPDEVTCCHCRKRIEAANRPASEPESPPNPALLGPNSFYTKIAGVTFANPNGSFRQDIIQGCRPGEMLELIRQPTLRVDPDGAIKVMRMNGEQLGYVPAYVSRGGDSSGLAARMDAGERYWCRITGMTGGGPYKNYGVNIEISNREFTEPLPDEMPDEGQAQPGWYSGSGLQPDQVRVYRGGAIWIVFATILAVAIAIVAISTGNAH